MAFEGQAAVKVIGAVAGADLSASTTQYKFVKFNGTGMQVILCAAATDIPCGVLQAPAPTSAVGQPVEVLALGESKVQVGATPAITAAGQLISTDGSAQAIKAVAGTDTTHYTVGLVVDTPASPAQASLITAMINCLAPGRAA